ncbi:hypothetical protein JCM8547_000024 [Rhodosporidiobolus lusitaniae]
MVPFGPSVDGYSSDKGSFVVPGLPVPLTLIYDPYPKRYHIEWEGAIGSPYVSKGHLLVKGGESSFLSVQLGEGRFPPSVMGSITSKHAAVAYKTLRVTVELNPAAEPAIRLQTVLQDERVEHKRAMEKQARLAADKLAEVSSRAQLEAALIRVRAEQQLEKVQTELIQRERAFSTLSFSWLNVPQPDSIRFYLPRTGQRLYVPKASLVQSCPYFLLLLSSDFAKGKPVPAPSGRRATAKYSFEESDDEGDERDEVKKDDSSSISGGILLLKTIAVTDTPSSTYLAVLVWLQRGRIAFSPLLSSFFSCTSSRPSAFPAHHAAASSLAANSPLLPPPVSPKSVFRLAHLLELDSIVNLALANLRSQLTPKNAPYELYSDAALAYDAMRDVVLDFIVENREKVEGAKGMDEMEGKMLACELGKGAAATAMLPAKRLRVRKSG